MSIEPTLRTRLLGVAAFAALVGQRLYPDRLPEAWTPAAGAAATFQAVGGSRLYHLRGPAGVTRARIRFQCWSASRGTSDAVAAAIRAAFDGWPLEAGAPVRSAFQEGFDIKDFDETAPGPSGAYRTITDWVFRFTES